MLNLIIHNQSEEQKQAVEGIMKSKESVFNEAKAGEKCYADSQGWLDTEEWADDAKLKHLEEFAKEIRANADAFVLIGVGGSNNAARSVVEALREDGAPEIILCASSPYVFSIYCLKIRNEDPGSSVSKFFAIQSI